MNTPRVSVVIPVWRDVGHAAAAVASVGDLESVETVVVATWEDAARVQQAPSLPGGARWLFARRGRGNQMNAGAQATSGDWLLFLHADSRLPEGWIAALDDAQQHECLAGCFRFALDSEGWRPRLWEDLVRWRVRWLQLPYGDQGLFVRRDLFQRLEGFHDLPLMEDVDFVARARAHARLYASARPMHTSARRWERDGWVRRSARNLVLMSRFRLGADPGALARAYTGQRESVVAVFGRAPSAPGKSRLSASTPALRRALLLDTWDAAAEGAWDTALLFTPTEAAAEGAALIDDGIRAPLLAPQRGGDLGERMASGFAELFAAGYTRVILIGSDLPTLPSTHLDQADHALRSGADVVLGPAGDGGYYLIGLRRARPELFSSMPWGSANVLTATLERASALGLAVKTLSTWQDVDTDDDLAGLAAAQGDRGRRTRELLRGG